MKKLRFKPYVKVFLNEKTKQATLSRVWEDNYEGIVYDMNDIGILILKKIGMSSIEQEKLLDLIKLKSNDSISEAIEIIEFLKKENYIEVIDNNFYYSEEVNEIYEKIIPLWVPFENEDKNRYKIQEEIMNKKVGLIGAGTIGFGVISKLITNGVRNFTIIDSDIVEKTNLTRQPLFSLNDVGHLKIEVIKKYVNDRVDKNNIITIDKNVSDINDLQDFNDVDVIINCADDDKINGILEEYVHKKQIPIFHGGGYLGHTGRIDPLVIPGVTKCFSCVESILKQNYDDLGEGISNDYVVSTNSSMSDFITSIMSFEILKFLAGSMDSILINNFLLVNFKDYSVKPLLPNVYTENCDLCKKI